MTTFEDLPLAKIKTHPHNIRRHVEADAEMIASVKGSGIITALTVAPAGKGYVLLAGHRRLDAACKAKLTTVPAMVRDDLITDEQHIEAMAIENLHRENLSAIEEADAYEQLTLLGVDATTIAEKTGRKKSTIVSRLKLAKLGDKAKDAMHDRQITLQQGEQIAKLEDDPEVLAGVLEALGTNNFSWKLDSAMRDHARNEAHAKNRTDFEKRGLILLERPETGWDYANGPRPLRYGEDESIADAWYEGDTWTGPALAITKVDPNAQTDDDKRAAARQKEAAEWETKREEQRKLDEARDSARTARLRHVVDNTPALKIPKGLEVLVGMAIGELIITPDFGPALAELNALADTSLQGDGKLQSWQIDASISAEIRSQPAANLAKLLVAALALTAETSIDTLEYNDDESTRANALAFFDWIESTGYALSDVDLERRNALEAPPEEDAA